MCVLMLCLHLAHVQAEPDTKALLLNTYAKLSHAYGEISASVGDVLRASATAMDQEVQQRSVEYLALGDVNLDGVKGQVQRKKSEKHPSHIPSQSPHCLA